MQILSFTVETFSMRRLIGLVLTIYPLLSWGQEIAPPRPSPAAIVSSKYKDTYLKITYCQPQRKGRPIFGSVVPFGKVWRTGANEATELTITRDVKINNFDLKAGTYSLFTIPDKEKWTIIINGELGLWGAYNYNDKADILRFDVPVTMLKDVVYEPFTIWVDQKNDKADLRMAWDNVTVIIPIQFLEPKS